MTSQKKKRNRRPRIITALILILSFLIAVIPGLSLSAQSSDTDEITIVREEQDRRTMSEKHFLCSDGSMMAVSYSGDVHYLDAEGNYQPIDNTLMYNAAKKQYRTAGNPNFSVSFAAAAGQPAAVIQDKEGNLLATATSVAFTTAGNLTNSSLAAQPASIFVQNEERVEISGLSKNAPEVTQVSELHSEILYQNAHTGGVSSEYAVDGYSLKENVIFDAPIGYTSIQTVYSMEGLCVEVTEEGSLLLYNDTWDLIYTVAAPYMYDAAGQVCPSVAVSAALTDGVWTVTYIPDEAWRTSSDRVYPVVFDPLISYDWGINMNDMYRSVYSENDNRNVFSQNSFLNMGYTHPNAGGYVEWTSFFNPTVYPTVPQGNVPTGVSFVFSVYETIGSGTIRVFPVEAWIKGEGEDNIDAFKAGNYTLGNWIEEFDYVDDYDYGNAEYVNLTYTVQLSVNEYGNCSCENVSRKEDCQCGKFKYGYVMYDCTEPGTSAHRLVFNNSRATNVADRPMIQVVYVPEGLYGKVTTLHHSSTGLYMTAEENYMVTSSTDATVKGLWRFQPADIGSFVIQSQYYEGKCLSVTEDGYVEMIDSPEFIVDNSCLWFVSVSQYGYTITNEKYLCKLYIDYDAEEGYIYRIDTDRSASWEEKQWQLYDLLPELNGVQTSLANLEAGGFLVPTSANTVGVVQGITEDVQWRFVQSPQQSFQIVPVDNPGKCLANVAGDVELVTVSSSFAETTQFWYLTESQGGYIIENVANHSKLSISNHNGTLSCTLTGMEQVWTFENYVAPEGVVTFKKANSDLYLKNLTGKAYEGEDIGVGSYEYTYDKCGFRLRYDEGFNAYYILPISSCNGQFMALTAKNTTSTTGNTVEQRCFDGDDKDNSGSDDWDDENADDETQVINHARQLFLMEWHLDGSYTLVLDSQGGTGNNPVLVLTANSDNTVTLSPRNADLSNQKWNLSAYQYQYKNAEGVTVTADYTEVENYYRSFGFISPFGNNAQGVSNYPLTITSDFGLRNSSSGGSTNHKGLDLKTGIANRNLYSPIGGGRVVAARTDRVEGDHQAGTLAEAGNYVVIETNITAFENPNYKVCIVYMHLHSADMSKVDTEVSTSDCLGTTGWTGLSSANNSHLHYGIFLKNSDMSATNWNTYPLSPLLFFESSGYAITKT